jgi:hypothetical protein
VQPGILIGRNRSFEAGEKKAYGHEPEVVSGGLETTMVEPNRLDFSVYRKLNPQSPMQRVLGLL